MPIFEIIEVNPFISANKTYVYFQTKLGSDNVFPALLINAWAYLFVSATKLFRKVAVKSNLIHVTGAEFLRGQSLEPEAVGIDAL